MPLAAIIEDKQLQLKVLCVHAGIGPSINKIEDIDRIQRPLNITLGEISNAT
jgi:hypothetical protein